MESLLGDPAVLALLLGAALVAGMVDAVAGGGGLIALPALLAAGLPPHIALGTNKLAGTFGTFSATLAYVGKGLVHPRRWTAVILATGAGAAAGSVAVWLVSAEVLRQLIPPLVAAAAVYVFLRRLPADARPGPEPTPPAGRGVALGGSLGFYDGFVGPGAGAFWTGAAMAVFHLDLVHASGVARLMNLVSNAASLAAFMVLGLVDYAVGLAMAAALALGSWVGAHTAIRFGAPFIRPVFVTVVLTLAGYLAWDGWLR